MTFQFYILQSQFKKSKFIKSIKITFIGTVTRTMSLRNFVIFNIFNIKTPLETLFFLRDFEKRRRTCVHVRQL